MEFGDAGRERRIKWVRKRELLEEMNLVEQWDELAAFIVSHQAGRRERRVFFRRRLEQYNLSQQRLAAVNTKFSAKGLLMRSGSVICPALVATSAATKYGIGEHDPWMHRTYGSSA